MSRRFFLRAGEILPLWRGVAAGDPVALRRAIGTRRSGRIAVLLGLLGLWLGTAWVGGHWPLAAERGLGWSGTRRSTPRLDYLAYQRLSLWLAGPAAMLAAPLRDTETGAQLCACLVIAAHLWLWRHLSHGMGSVVAD